LILADEALRGLQGIFVQTFPFWTAFRLQTERQAWKGNAKVV